MNKGLDASLKKRRKAQESEKYTALLSALPLLSMLQKLLIRKQNGKKPYSMSFDFSSKMEEIKKTENKILDVSKALTIDDTIKEDLMSIAEIASLAKEETRLESLKGDFVYLSDMFAEISRFLVI